MDIRCRGTLARYEAMTVIGTSRASLLCGIGPNRSLAGTDQAALTKLDAAALSPNIGRIHRLPVWLEQDGC